MLEAVAPPLTQPPIFPQTGPARTETTACVKDRIFFVAYVSGVQQLHDHCSPSVMRSDGSGEGEWK
jgi:hypothetical protein